MNAPRNHRKTAHITLNLCAQYLVKLEIRSLEHGICPIAESTMTELFLSKFRRFGH